MKHRCSNAMRSVKVSFLLSECLKFTNMLDEKNNSSRLVLSESRQVKARILESKLTDDASRHVKNVLRCTVSQQNCSQVLF